jgi:magnesium transporter
MVLKSKRGASKAGLPPGTLVHVGEERTEPVKLNVIDYDDNTFHEHTAQSLEECFHYSETKTATWIDVVGIHNVGMMEKLANHFHIHPLMMEDIVNSTTRPKAEEAEYHVFIALKMARFDDDTKELLMEQVSLIVSPHVVISFQETEGDVFNPVRDRIRNHRGRIRSLGIDYLAYSLMDMLVDHYFVVLEKIGDELEQMEENVMSEECEDLTHDLHHIKGELMLLRKAMWPMRDVMSQLSRGEVALFKKSTIPFIRDVYDHTVQVVDSIENYRELSSSLHDVQLSKVGQRANEVMKVLTMMSTVFIPLTFIAGIYGMNFDYMPELRWKYGYAMVWGVMLVIVVGLLAFFRKRKWL